MESLQVEMAPPPRAVLGCVQLPTDENLEIEGPTLIARIPGVQLRLQRVRLDGTGLEPDNYASARGYIADAAATIQPVGSLDALGLACTSLSFTLGPEVVQAELRAGQPGAAVTDMATAQLEAIAHVGARTLALLTPYVDSLHVKNIELLRGGGYDVVSDLNLRLSTDRQTSSVTPSSIMALARRVDTVEADAVVLGCSALRVCTPGFLDALEACLGKPVISSQQAFFWRLLRLAGIVDQVVGYGSLMLDRGRLQTAQDASVYEPDNVVGTEDVYPSRMRSPGLCERVDPVVDWRAHFPGPLSEAQLRSFESRGYVIMREVFRPTETARLRDKAAELRSYYQTLSYEELDRTTDMRVITERGGALAGEGSERPILKSIWQVHLPAEHAPHMRSSADLTARAVRDARLVNTARQILGDEVYIHQSRINYQPGWGQDCLGGSGFLWHQDFEQWHSEDGMPRMRAVSIAIILERSVPMNGALMVIPGSHRHMIQTFGDTSEFGRYQKGALSRGPEFRPEALRHMADTCGIVYCAGEPGDVIVFDCNILHGSHTNISPWNRMMFFAVYNAISNVPAERPYRSPVRRPEHISSHDPRWAGVPLPALYQSLDQALD